MYINNGNDRSQINKIFFRVDQPGQDYFLHFIDFKAQISAEFVDC